MCGTFTIYISLCVVHKLPVKIGVR